ncbi:MAG: methylmalonyl-CoA epimerase [Oligoflexia bacterium]|nr:methylmalonyl-CoA epimerase [Oligoflexia bacterium]
MSKAQIEIDHIGIAVESLDTSYPFWKAIGFNEDKNPEVVSDQKVKVGMLALANNANIELLEATQADSPIAKFISKRGPGIHHICLRVKDIHKILNQLKALGIKLINESPVKGAHNCLVAFIHPSSTGGVLVELSQKQNSKDVL